MDNGGRNYSVGFSPVLGIEASDTTLYDLLIDTHYNCPVQIVPGCSGIYNHMKALHTTPVKDILWILDTGKSSSTPTLDPQIRLPTSRVKNYSVTSPLPVVGLLPKSALAEALHLLRHLNTTTLPKIADFIAAL